MERVAVVAARRHLAADTVECYSRWIREVLLSCRVDGRWREPGALRGAEVSAVLTRLTVERRSARSTQTQAMNAIVFLYRDVLADELGADHLGPIEGLRAGRRARVPTVLSPDEGQRALGRWRRGRCSG